MCKSKSNAYNPWVVNYGKASGHSTEVDPVLFVPLWAEEHRMEDGAGHGQVGPDTTVKNGEMSASSHPKLRWWWKRKWK